MVVSYAIHSFLSHPKGHRKASGLTNGLPKSTRVLLPRPHQYKWLVQDLPRILNRPICHVNNGPGRQIRDRHMGALQDCLCATLRLKSLLPCWWDGDPNTSSGHLSPRKIIITYPMTCCAWGLLQGAHYSFPASHRSASWHAVAMLPRNGESLRLNLVV